MGHFWFTSGSYTGNATARSFTGLGFQPQMVFITNTTDPDITQVTQSSMGNNNSDILTGDSAILTARITSLDSDGFSIGTGNTVNRSGRNFVWFAWRQGTDTIKYFEQGSYTGNGSTPRTITSAINPCMITVNPAYTGGAQSTAPTFKTLNHTVTADSSYYRNLADYTSSQAIRSLGTANFTIGSAALVNANTQTYNWFGLATLTGHIKEGKYTGNNAARSITGLGFKPDLVVIKGANNGRSLFASSDFTAGSSAFFDGTANTTTAITSLDTDGFSLGTNVNANANGIVYYWYALVKHKTRTYTINSNAKIKQHYSKTLTSNAKIKKLANKYTITENAKKKKKGIQYSLTSNLNKKKLANKYTILTAAKIKKLANQRTVLENAKIKKKNIQHSLFSTAAKKKRYAYAILSAAKIKHLAYQRSINSNSKIKKLATQHSLVSNSAKKKRHTYTLNSNSFRKKPSIQHSLNSNANIFKQYSSSIICNARITKRQRYTLLSKASIKHLAYLHSLNSNANILYITPQNIFSALKIKKRYSKTILSRANLKKTLDKYINSNSFITKTTIHSLFGYAIFKKKNIRYNLFSRANLKRSRTNALQSNTYITKTAQQNIILIRSYIKKVGFYHSHLSQRANIKKIANQKTINSDSFITKTSAYSLTSFSRVKKLSTKKTLLCNARIRPYHLKTITCKFNIGRASRDIYSDAYIYRAGTETLTCNYRIKHPLLYSNAKIKKLGYQKTIISFSRIKYLGYQYNLNSADYIKKRNNRKTIIQRAQIKKVSIQRTLNSNAYILDILSSSLNSNSFIKKRNNRKTIIQRDIIKKLANQKNLISNSFIDKHSENSLNSNSFIKKIAFYHNHITQRAAIKKLANLKTLTSSSFITKTTLENLNSNSFIKKVAFYHQHISQRAQIKKLSNLRTRISNSFIKEITEESLTSIYYIKKTANYHGHISGRWMIKAAYQKTRSSNSKIKQLGLIRTITSNSFINKHYSYTLTSRAWITKAYLKTLILNSKIKKSYSYALNQDAFITKRYSKSLNSNSLITKGISKTIYSFLRIKSQHTLKTIFSNSKIKVRKSNTLTSLSYVLKEYTGGAIVTVENTNFMDSSTDSDTFHGVAPYSAGIYRVTVSMVANPTPINVRLKLTINGHEYLSDNTQNVNVFAFLPFSFFFSSRPRIEVGQTLYVTKIATYSSGQTLNIRTSNLGDNSGWNFHFDRGPDVSIILAKDLVGYARIKKQTTKSIYSHLVITRIESNTISQNAYLSLRVQESLFSDFNIYGKTRAEIKSRSFIVVAGQEGSINSYSRILLRSVFSLDSNLLVKKTLESSLDSDAVITKSAHKPITCRSHTKQHYGGIPTPAQYTGLVSLYRMNEIQWNGIPGEVVDEKNNNNGRALQNSQTITDGLFGRAGSFTGTRSGVNCGTGASFYSNYVSVNTWVKATTVLKAYNDIINSGRYRLTIKNNSRVEWWVYTAGSGWISATSNGAITLNKWTQISATYDGSRAKLYINGVLQTTQGIGTGVISWSGNTIYLGQSGANTNEYAGVLDEVGIWDVVLSVNDIVNLWKQNTMLQSNYVIVRRFQKTLTCNARIRRRITKTIFSNYRITKKAIKKTLISRAYIVHTFDKTIIQNIYVKKKDNQRTLTQMAFVIKTRHRDITTDSDLEARTFIPISSELHIFKPSIKKTITQLAVITESPQHFLIVRAYVTKKGIYHLNSNAMIKRKYILPVITSHASLKQTYEGGVTQMDSNTNLEDSFQVVDTFTGTAPRLCYIYGINVKMLAIGVHRDVYLKVTAAGKDYYSIPITVQTTPAAPGYQFVFETLVPLVAGQVFTVTKLHFGTVQILTSTFGDNSGWNYHFDEGPIIRTYTINPISSDAFITQKANQNTLNSDAQIFKKYQHSLTSRTEIKLPNIRTIGSDSWIRLRHTEPIISKSRIKKTNPGVRKTITSRLHLGIAGEWSDTWCVNIISPNIGQLRSNYSIYAHMLATITQDAKIMIRGIRGIDSNYFVKQRYHNLINMNIYIRSGAGSKPCLQSARYVNKPVMQSARYVNKPVILTVNSLSCSMRKNPDYYHPRKLIRTDYFIIAKMTWMRPIQSNTEISPTHQFQLSSSIVIAPRHSYRLNCNYVIERRRSHINSNSMLKKWYYSWLYTNTLLKSSRSRSITQDYWTELINNATLGMDSMIKASVTTTIPMDSMTKTMVSTTILSDGEIL